LATVDWQCTIDNLRGKNGETGEKLSNNVASPMLKNFFFIEKVALFIYNSNWFFYKNEN